MLLPNGVETRNLPFTPNEAIVIGAGQHVYSAIPRSPEFIGVPLHVYDKARGRIANSFGNSSGRFHPRDPLQAVRSVAHSQGAAFWAANLNQYRIEKWNSSGELLLTIEREARWFEPWTRLEGVARLVEPKPVLVGVREDSDGHLWTFHRVADEDWAPQEPGEVRGTHTRTTALQKEKLFDTTIEVIDVASGRLLAHLRVDQNIVGVAGSNLFYSYEEFGMGHPRFTVWRVELRR